MPPTLRNIELTAPYMHDGRFRTLEEVIEHYASGGHYADNIDPFIPQIAGIKLTPKQKRQILLFLKTLTDTSFVNNKAFQNPYK
jgi:cytochrome c peroxidase